MNGTILFRQLRQFHQDIKELVRQLNQFEQNVSDSFVRVGDQFLPRLSPTPNQRANYVAKIGDLVELDSSGGNLIVTFPAAAKGTEGVALGLVRLSGSNTITLVPVSGKINGAATVTLSTTVKAYLFVSDGSGWWGY